MTTMAKVTKYPDSKMFLMGLVCYGDFESVIMVHRKQLFLDNNKCIAIFFTDYSLN